MAIVLRVISGYLGAGKTTLVNRLIDSPDAGRLCVIVNDFGALSVDAAVLSRGDGRLLALANGCICCSASAGLYHAFETALSLDPAPDQVLVEASGVADPARIAAVARAEPDFSPGGIATVVDPGALPGLLGDPLVAPDVTRQVNAAHVVLLSRVDLLEPLHVDQAREQLERIAPDVRTAIANDVATCADLRQVLETARASMNRGKETGVDAGRYAQVTVRGGCLDGVEALAASLSRIDDPSLRVKGIVHVPGRRLWQRLDFVHGVLSLHPVEAGENDGTGFVAAVFLDRAGRRAVLEALLDRHLCASDGNRRSADR